MTSDAYLFTSASVQTAISLHGHERIMSKFAIASMTVKRDNVAKLTTILLGVATTYACSVRPLGLNVLEKDKRFIFS